MLKLRHTAALGLGLALPLAACDDIDMGATTAPYAHESPSDTGPGFLTTFMYLRRGGFFGGSGTDLIDDVAVDGDGTIYVVGGTGSADFPTTDGSALDSSAPAGCSACPFDAFVAAIAADGTTRWVRLLQSPGYDRLGSLELVGPRLFVGGSTGQRAGLPGWHGGADPTGERGEQDGLVCALSAADGTVEACRYVGGTGPGGVTDLTRHASSTLITVGMITAAGEDLHLDAAYSAAFAGRHRATAAGADVAVFGLSTDLTAADNLRWATYVGGSGDERGTPSVLFEGDGSNGLVMYVLTETTSTDAPVPRGFQTTAPADGTSAYFAALRDDGSELLYGTYAGGNGEDRVTPHAISDIGGSTYLAITTTSTDMPSAGFSPQPLHGGNGSPGCGDGDVWIARLYDDQVSFSLTLGTTRYLGGGAGERLGGISHASTSSGPGIVVTGATFSANFPQARAAQPLLAGTPCSANPGNADAFALELGYDLVVHNGSYLGGGVMDRGAAVARDDLGHTVVVGETASSDFPRLPPGDDTFGGGRDGFIAQFTAAAPPPPVDAGVDAPDPIIDAGLDGIPGSWDAIDHNDGLHDGGGCCQAGGSPAAPVTVGFWVLALILFRRRRPR